jgi:hypothetical protein
LLFFLEKEEYTPLSIGSSCSWALTYTGTEPRRATLFASFSGKRRIPLAQFRKLAACMQGLVM